MKEALLWPVMLLGSNHWLCTTVYRLIASQMVIAFVLHIFERKSLHLKNSLRRFITF